MNQSNFKTVRAIAAAAIVALASGTLSAQEAAPVSPVNYCDSIDVQVFIIDGVEASDTNDISPDDIESIEVIKDPAITRIFRPRLGGVVLITTKSKKVLQPIFEAYEKQLQRQKQQASGQLMIR